MPSRGSAFAVAVASTTFSPRRTTADPWACLANFPVSNESVFPPLSVTVTVVGSGFIRFPLERYEQWASSYSPEASSEQIWLGMGHVSHCYPQGRLRLKNALVESSSMLPVSPETD